jgi:UTP--glucose-1-phosphate uridylyltransferase
MENYDLHAALSKLDSKTRDKLAAHGFSAERLERLAHSLTEGDAEHRRDARNRVAEARAPAPGEIKQAPARGDEPFAKIGFDALEAGKLAFCVMAGGMATRMGGVVKALVEIADHMSFLDARLVENKWASERAGRPVPLWLMTSDATDGPIREALKEKKAPPHVRTFVQDLSLRLTESGEIFFDSQGNPSTYAPGHGDLPDALIRSGYLDEHLKNGGEYVWIANIDNLGATLDETLLGFFIESKKELMVEVTGKANDKGGIPVHANGKLQVLEEFRLPKGFDASSVDVFNTNTFLARAKSLREARVEWSFFEVQKKVDGKPAVQFERLLQELTAVLDTIYVKVPRTETGGGAVADPAKPGGANVEARFLPVKDLEELERRRSEIRAVIAARFQ